MGLSVGLLLLQTAGMVQAASPARLQGPQEDFRSVRSCSAALEPQAGECREVGAGQEPLSSAETSARCFLRCLPSGVDELLCQELCPAGTCPRPGGVLTLRPLWRLKGALEDAVRWILDGKPFELLSHSQGH